MSNEERLKFLRGKFVSLNLYMEFSKCISRLETKVRQMKSCESIAEELKELTEINELQTLIKEEIEKGGQNATNQNK